MERFWNKVDKSGAPTGCWLWTARRSERGYGRFWVNHKMRRAHRYSWELHNGLIPNNLCVLHKCDNPPCVNPAHLFLGTNGDNIQDAIRKGRASVGRRVLNEQKVREIRALQAQGLGARAIARIYNVERSTISDINTGRTWKDVR